MATLETDERGVLIACGACGQKNRLAFEQLGGQARCGKCKVTISAPAEPMDVGSTEDFDRLVSRASIPVVVDYWAPWCGPCRMVAPELATVAARNAGRLMVVKVNTDVLTDLAQRLGIRSIPTLAVFAGGRESVRTAGARPAAEIESLITQATRNLHHRAG